MRRTFAIICLLAGLAALPLVPARAQDSPAQGQFVEAFLLVRKGEEEERNNKLKEAMQNYRTAANMLTRVKVTWPEWQKDIVEFRLKRTMDSIDRLQGQLAPGTGNASVLPPITPSETPLPPLETPEGIPLPPIDNNPPEIRTTVKGGPKKPTTPQTPTGSLDLIRQQISELENRLQNSQEELRAEKQKSKQLSDELETAVKTRKTAETAQKKAQDLADLYQKNVLEIKNTGEKNDTRMKELETQLAEAKRQRDSAQTELAAATEREDQLTSRAKELSRGAREAVQFAGKIKTLEGVIADERKKGEALTAQIAILSKSGEEARTEIAKLMELKKQSDKLAADNVELLTAERKKSESLVGKVAGLTKERDDARSEITKLKELNSQTDKLITDNAGLIKKLGEAEKQIMNFKVDSAEKEQALASLQKQVTDSQKALLASNQTGTKLTAEIGELQKKVGDYSKQIQQFKTEKTASTEEQRKMTDENRLLQGIVMRVLQEDANRAQRKKMIQKEMDKLQIQSDALLKQIGFLTQPVIKLSTDERRLFKKADLMVQDPNTIATVLPGTAPESASPAQPENPAPTPDKPNENPSVSPNKPETPPKNTATPNPKNTDVAKLTTPTSKIDDLPKKEPTEIKTEPGTPEAKPPGNSTGVETSGIPNLPPDVKPLAEQAKAAFDREKYADSERLYDKALQLAPNNVYLLSNRGVVQFRAGKLKQAEDSFRKAIAIAPEDSFSWCTLGIVYYSQEKYDDAVNALTKSLAINSKNATAHNYLGITAAQKGWMEAAQKELDTAIQLEPKYADAWFNLAVVLATKTPSNKPDAKKAYDKAVELGAASDPAMETLVK